MDSSVQQAVGLLELVTEKMTAAVTRCSRDLTYVWANQRYAEWIGRPLQEIVGHPIKEVLGDEAFQTLRPYFERVLAGEKVTYEEEVAFRGIGQRWASGTYTPTFDSAGAADGWVAVVLDVTERRRAEQAQFRLAAIVESSEDAIIAKDLNGIITSWNPAARHMFGFAPEEAIGQNIKIIVPEELRGEEDDILHRVRRGERIQHFETTRLHKSGIRLEVSLTVSPVRDSKGRIIGISKIARDITGRRQAEEALKQREFSARLLQVQDKERRRIARELHDSVGQLLMAANINAAEVAKEKDNLSSTRARCVEESASLIQQATEEIRTLSHLLHPPLLDEVGLLSALKWYVDGFAERSNIKVQLEVPDSLDRLPQEHELALFRIVQESLTNIYRHSGSSTAVVRLVRTSREIKLEVKDQGQGINPETQSKIATGESGGVGLRGMRERLRPLGGTLEIQTDKNGTSVLAVLPLPDENSGGAQNEPVDPPEAKNKKRVSDPQIA